jgi:hypothetical protein
MALPLARGVPAVKNHDTGSSLACGFQRAPVDAVLLLAQFGFVGVVVDTGAEIDAVQWAAAGLRRRGLERLQVASPEDG